jgi:hypothetical protein
MLQEAQLLAHQLLVMVVPQLQAMQPQAMLGLQMLVAQLLQSRQHPQPGHCLLQVLA